MTYKALAAVHWVTKHCSHVPWTLHADDDIILDPFILHKLLHNASRDELHCNLVPNSPPYRKGVWKVSLEQFPQPIYPNFCSGLMWFTATSNLKKLLRASRVVNFLWLDDVYLTGLLVKEAGIPHRNINSLISRHFFQEQVGKTLVWYHTIIGRHYAWSSILKYHNQTRIQIRGSRLSQLKAN